MAKQRYKFETNLTLKRTHRKMMKQFEVRDVSASNTKDRRIWIFFTVRCSEEELRLKNHFTKIGIELQKV